MSQINDEEIVRRFKELRAGYWEIVFHTNLTLAEKRGFVSYFLSADQYVVSLGGDSEIKRFNDTCLDCNWEKLMIKKGC